MVVVSVSANHLTLLASPDCILGPLPQILTFDLTLRP